MAFYFASIVLLVLLLALTPPAHATLRTDVSITPQFLSSAPPILFVGENFTYALSSQVNVNWTCVTCPLSVIGGGPLSKFAGLHGKPTVAGTLTFSIKITDGAFNGGLNAWQNWTANVVAQPKIITTPSFIVVPTLLYDYKPVTVGGAGTWTFTGAPYFAFNSTTGEVKATTPTVGTYLNTLTFTVSGVSWVQSWTTTSQTVSPTVSFATTLGSHTVNAVLPNTDVPGAGYGGVYLGAYPIVNSTNYGATETYNVTYFPGTFSYDIGVVGTPHALNLYIYAQPLTTVKPFVNGAALAPVAVPSSGFSVVSYTPLQTTLNLKATVVSDTVAQLTWSNPAGTYTNVSVSYGPQSGGACALVNGTGASVGSFVSTAQVNGLVPGVTYCFAVQLWNGGVASSLSNTVVLTMSNSKGYPPPPHPISQFPLVVPPVGVLVFLGVGIGLMLGGFLLLIFVRRSTLLWLLLVLAGVIILIAVSVDPSFFAGVPV